MYDEKVIADAVKKAIEQINSDNQDKEIKVGISARHVHLSRKDLDTLFGEGFELTKKKTLMGREFASDQFVTLVGPSLKSIENSVIPYSLMILANALISSTFIILSVSFFAVKLIRQINA
jgi:propanediol utilization protein